MKNNHCQLWLTCKNKEEASKIATKLLDLKLITCAKLIPGTSIYRWHGKIERANETVLIMETRQDLFDQIEKEISSLHSYDTFVLECVAVDKVSKKALPWMKEELK